MSRALAVPGSLREVRAFTLSGASRAWPLTALLLGGGLLLAWLAIVPLDALAAPIRLPWWALAICFYLAEIKVVHLQFRREAHSYNLSEVPLVAGLFLADPLEVVLAHAVGGGLGVLVHRRPAAVKLAFNVSLFLAQAVVAVLAFRALVVPGEFGPHSWLSALGATLAANALALASLTLVVRLAEGRVDAARVSTAIKFGFAVAITNTGLALVGMTVLWADGPALWLLAIPALLGVIAFRSYGAYAAEKEQKESLELLYEATRVLHGSKALEAALVEVLRAVQARFRAEVAEVVLLSSEDGTDALRTVVGPDDRVEVMTRVRLDDVRDASRLRAAQERIAFRVAPRRRGERLGERIAEVDLRDAIAGPLLGERTLLGTMCVANRQGAVGTFRPEELALFEAVANHVGLALENGRLGLSLRDAREQREQLRFLAYHDALTGLATRELFEERLAGALARRDDEGNVPVVFFLDLDDFKSINDTYGHVAGDHVLRAVATRLRECVRPNDLCVRLHGDEFAILLDDGRDMGAVISIAERVVEAVAKPVAVEGQAVATSASVGVAAANAADTDPAVVARNADVAMYTAKTRGKGRYCVFAPEMHAAVESRRELRRELERAVERSEFVVRYQPIADLETGAVRGFEALLRWAHPTRGLLQPAEFIGLAEESGLIVPIERWVLAEACARARAWSDERPGLTMSVNVSPRQLKEADFPIVLRRILAETGLQPDRLVLEVKEEHLSGNAGLAVTTLRAIHALGVRLAVDNFGSGVSSLGFLARFPLDTLKIAKSFVDALDADPEGGRLAEAMVGLGHSLRLSVTAEGIERPDQVKLLRALRCDQGQGFYFSRPLDPPEVGSLLLAGLPRAA